MSILFKEGGIRVKTYLFGVELQEETDGHWNVWIPALPGLTSWGHTKEEALKNIQDDAEAYVEDIVEICGRYSRDRRANNSG